MEFRTPKNQGYSFSYNAYIFVGHFENPPDVVDAILPGSIARDTDQEHVTFDHVGCLAAIMMFRIDVHHPINLKKFDILGNKSWADENESSYHSAGRNYSSMEKQCDRPYALTGNELLKTNVRSNGVGNFCGQCGLSVGHSCNARQNSHTCMKYALPGRNLSQDVSSNINPIINSGLSHPSKLYQFISKIRDV
ncbi:hypothetical protein DPMN_165015 [Dreissena polymorpha]|uniref:Uncharacterized protein n=1 Tax=Dreissena polymorpha TaxID=45954 RepID=A0A9D4EZJ1_DREPO|nr:hypothetical protein DPMN_165015 [Dreissena polymorpha]